MSRTELTVTIPEKKECDSSVRISANMASTIGIITILIGYIWIVSVAENVNGCLIENS